MAIYYIKRVSENFCELRQERFRSNPKHPHDVCAVGTEEQVRDMCEKFGFDVKPGVE